MIGYPITYGDSLEEGNSFTSEILITKISDYCSNEKNRINFNKGYNLGLLVFGIGSLVLASSPAFASDSEILPDSSGTGGGANCPEPGPTPRPETAGTGSLARVPTAERGAFTASALGICGIAIKSGAYWIGFVCAAAVIVGVRMASIPADQAL